MIQVTDPPHIDQEAVEAEARKQLDKDQPEVIQLKPVPFSELEFSHPELRPAVIDGILREGEVCNVIAAPKVGKSFLAGNLAWSISTGRPFLGREVQQGRVLVLDNELHRETLSSRLGRIASAMQISESERGQLDVISLRGRYSPVTALCGALDVEPGYYKVVVLDALYRCLPEGCSENDNAQMMNVYNHLDSIAEQWRSAIVCVHHSSKGNQADKGVTDVGAGAGAISRAADSHLIIRPHDDGEQCVLEAVCRSFPPVDPVSIRFEWPVWYATTTEPIVRQPTRQRADKQQADDEKAIATILSRIPKDKPIVQQTLLRKCGLTQSRGLRLLSIVESKELAIRTERKRKGQSKKAVFWSSKS